MKMRSLLFCAAAVLAAGPAFAGGAVTATTSAAVIHTPASTQAAATHASTSPLPSLYARAQTKLKTDGLYTGAINGRRDAATISAIRQFQTQHHLTVNGRLNTATKQALGV